MSGRFISIWFRYLTTDWLTNRHPVLRGVPLVFTAKERGRVIITSANAEAEQQGIGAGMAATDAKAIVPCLQVVDDIPGLAARLLNRIGEWCIRFSPVVAADMPGGLVLDVTGCAHLWGGEQQYLADIVTKLQNKGYDVRAAIADTIGMAWAVARFGKTTPIIETRQQAMAVMSLPLQALRLEPVLLERLQKLGFCQIKSIMEVSRSALRRRFGEELLQRLDQFLGRENEILTPLQPVSPYEERLPCLEPIRTATGIEIALQQLLEQLCCRLRREEKGLRAAILKCYRIDGKTVQVEIGTNRASRQVKHLFRLFELKIPTIEPALGIELFTLLASKVEEVSPAQEALWSTKGCGLEDMGLAELLDRLAGKIGADAIHRYLPEEHYWPERSIRATSSLLEAPATAWRVDRPRPMHLLARPEPIEVTVPVPDYPPMLFIYKKKLHQVKKADGPERIEREWWLETGELRDYYHVEDEEGQRYWLFRSGHYAAERSDQWFIHGFFA